MGLLKWRMLPQGLMCARGGQYHAEADVEEPQACDIVQGKRSLIANTETSCAMPSVGQRLEYII